MQTAGFQASPFMDNLDYTDFGDSSLDFSFNPDPPAMIGDLPELSKSETPENDIHEKRSHPDDDDDEDSNSGNDPKRRESTDKVPKKPGRKPLTSEPSSVCEFVGLA